MATRIPPPQVVTPNSTQGRRYCTKCDSRKPISAFPRSKSIFAQEGYLPVCYDCLRDHLIAHNWSWDELDRLCRFMDIPWIPRQFELLHKQNNDNTLPIYVDMFFHEAYESIDWKRYHTDFVELLAAGQLQVELPELREEYYRKLKKKWGGNYSIEDLDYLEEFHKGLLATQNISGTLQNDQALKIAKISLELEEQISSKDDFKKTLDAYDKLVKVAGFTPKNLKSNVEFDSVGELVAWLEKRGWRNEFYDDVRQDIVDETIHNMKASLRALYTQEPGLGDMITRRVELLNMENKTSSVYGLLETDADADDRYDNEGYASLKSAVDPTPLLLDDDDPEEAFDDFSLDL